jgi:hypothetical protein
MQIAPSLRPRVFFTSSCTPGASFKQGKNHTKLLKDVQATLARFSTLIYVVENKRRELSLFL